MSHCVTQENHFFSHLLSSVSFITMTQTPLGNSDDHRNRHKPVGFGYSPLLLPHHSPSRRHATEFKRWFVTWLFRKSLLETTETHKRDSNPNTRDVCVSPGGVQAAWSWSSNAGGATHWARVALT